LSKEYRLKRGVGPGYETDPDNVWLLKHALREEGLYAEPDHGMTPFPDSNLFNAIKEFQARNGLRADGIAKPGGETELRLRKQLHAVATFKCILCDAWHGGLYSPLICHNCWVKANS